MPVSYKLLARSVVFIMVLGLLPGWWPDSATAQDTATYTLVKYDCAPGYDPGSGDASAAFANCTTPAAGVTFTFQSGDQSYGNNGAQQTNGSGQAGWNGIPLGTGYSITESIPNGYGTPWVYCEISGNPNNPGDVQRSFFQAPGGTMDVGYTDTSLTAYTQANCTWFNIPPADSTTQLAPQDNGGLDTVEEPGSGSTITITKYLCERIALPLDGPGVTYEILSTQCTDVGDGFGFSVQTANGAQTKTTGTDGIARFEDLQPGSVTVSEALPTGYDSWGVYCKTDQPGDDYAMYADTGIYQFDYTVEAGKQLSCSWFDQMPAYDNSVKVVKYLCYEGDLTSTSPDFAALTAGCQEPGVDWQIAISTDDFTMGGTTGADGSTDLGFDTPGQITLIEVLKDSYSPLALYCNDGSSPDAWTSFPLTSDANRATATLDMSAGGSWTCYLFNAAPPDTGINTGTETGQTITITKYTCENFLVRGTPTRTDFETYCTEPASGIEFTLFAGMEVIDTESTGTTGVAVLTAPSAGQYQIAETPVDGYLTAAVYCTSSATDDPAIAESTEPRLTIDVTLDYPVTCAWYNGADIWQGGDTYDPDTIVVHKFDCPPGYPADGSVGYEDLLGGCTVPASGITFSATQGGNQIASGATDAQGEVVLTGASVGVVQVSEPPIEGWDPPRVFCTDVPSGPGRTLVSYDEMTVTTWSIDYDIPADSWLDCYWFDRLPNEGMDGQPIQITIHKIICDPGIDNPGDTFAGAETECVTPENGVEFTVTGGDAISATGPTDTNGYAEFNGLAPGSIQIAETPRPDYTTGAVFCSYSYGTTVYDYQRIPAENDAIALYLAAGYKLDCYWFNIVKVPTGHVYIFKYFCDSEIEYSSYADFTACSKSDAGIPFEVRIGTETWNEATDTSGLAAFYDLPVTSGDPAVIRESAPEGYRPYAVFCGYSDYAYIPPTTWDERPIDPQTASIATDIVKDQYLMCYWYNVPDQHDPQVWIYKYDCGDDANWHWNYHQLLTNCDTPAPGVEFGFGPQGSGPSLSITDDQGRWLYASLTPGVWYWTESYPSGYSGAVVYCQWVNSHGTGDYQQAEVEQGTFWLDLDYNDVVTCYVFDFPQSQAPPTPTPHSGSGGSGGSGSGSPPPPLGSNIPTGSSGGSGGTAGSGAQQTDPNAPATLIIVKRTCPAGYNMYTDDADVETDCTDLTKEIDFELTSLTVEEADGTPVPNEPVQQTTGVDGKATWSNLAAGPYLLVESMPEETHTAFIWTCSSDQREFQLEYPFTPLSYAGSYGETGITLIPGETLECAWYDIPIGKATVSILAFDCPGTTVIVAQCEPAGAGVQFALAPAGAFGVILQLTTDDTGSDTTEGAAGTYTFTEAGANPCLIDSDAIDEEGHVVLTEAEPTEIRVYNCGGS